MSNVKHHPGLPKNRIHAEVPSKKQLFAAALQALEAEGWQVEPRPAGCRDLSARVIRKGRASQLIAIRTSRNTWFGFGPSGVKPENYGRIVFSTVDSPLAPTEILITMCRGNEVEQYRATHEEERRRQGEAGSLNINFMPHYDRTVAGGGLGLLHPPIARLPLQPAQPTTQPPANAEAAAILTEMRDSAQRLAKLLGGDATVQISINL